MALYVVTEEEMVSIADILRNKKGISTTISFPDEWKNILNELSSGSTNPNVPPSGNSNLTIGEIKFPAIQKVSRDAPLIVNHNLGITPSTFLIFSLEDVPHGQEHRIYSVIATNINENCSITAFYIDKYPERYFYYGPGNLSGSVKNSSRSFIDVWEANETSIKIGAFKDVGAAFMSGITYKWIAIS